MHRIDRHDLEDISQHLSLKLQEVTEVSFFSNERNTQSFNRIFMVIEAGNTECYLTNHSVKQEFLMSAGKIYFIPCNTDLEFLFQPDMNFISLHFNLEFFDSYDVFTGDNECMEIDDKGLIESIHEIVNSKTTLSGVCRLHGLVMQAASLFLNKSPEFVNNLIYITSKYRDVFQYVRTHADAHLRVSDIAEYFGYSREYISRDFSRDCGMTLKQFISKELMLRAEKMLFDPDCTSRMVADKLRFNNEYYFSRFFKQHSGMTPGQFHQQAQLRLKKGYGGGKFQPDNR